MVFIMKLFRKHRKKIRVYTLVVFAIVLLLTGRLVYIAVFDSEQLARSAKALHERERDIKASRGKLISRDGNVLADNKTVCTVSVISSQLVNKEEVIDVLTEALEMSEEKVRSYVEKKSSREIIKTNVTNYLTLN